MIPKHAFGRTGHMSTRVIFGAWAFNQATQAEADRTMELLLRWGVNHIDTAAKYGVSEERLGPWMEHHRDDFFLATKTGQRDYRGAREEIHRSLERLRVSQVDLLQFHNIIQPQDWEQVFGPGGALEAALEAQEQGLTRYIGATAHGWTGPRVHLKSLERFPFDSVLLACNYLMMQNADFAADFARLTAVCQERNVALQTMKAVARRPWGVTQAWGNSWYDPITDQADIDRAVHWMLARPGVFLSTIGEMEVLPKVLDAASRFAGAPPDEEMREMVQRLEMQNIWEL
ncbi:MAG: aldo/keto reductase [Chloroflexi bacterium]|nr:aldo/keto reductase [Chloroflexota bacterium]